MNDIPDRGPRYEPEPEVPVDEDAEYEAHRQRELDEEIAQRKANKLLAKEITDNLINVIKRIGGGR